MMHPKTHVSSYPKDPDYIRKTLADQVNFQNRLNSLSKEAQEHYASIYARGRSFKTDREMLKRKIKVFLI